MASLSRPALMMDFDHERQTVWVRVRCTVRVSDIERCLMTSCPGTWFVVQAYLFGDDGPDGPSGDRSLYYFQPSKSYGAHVPSERTRVTFIDQLAWSVLDEDDGVDEVYARVTLRNL